MITNFIIADSGTYKVINFLKTTKRGTILTIDDLMGIKDLTYTHIRSILVNLCKKNVLIRICRGVYCYPKIENGRPILPPIITVLYELAKKENYELCPAGEYAKYLLGIRETIPSNIICYNNGKAKTYNFENGISVKILPSKKHFSPFINNKNLRLLTNYINNIGIENICECDRKKLAKYYRSLELSTKYKTTNIPSEVVTFCEIQ